MSKIDLDKKTERKLLDRLQEESWQLELIVSGIIIFLLLGLQPTAYGFGEELSRMTMGTSSILGILIGVYGFFYTAYLALIGIFLFHLAVRGLWIGAIGLRSVSGDFDFEELMYNERYVRFLRKRLGSFDDYIGRLERNASVTFSLAFLLFFAILSIGLFILALAGGVMVFTLGKGNISPDSMNTTLFMILFVLTVAWVLIMLFSGLLYLIDFLTSGWIKKRSWIGTLYYPFYRFLGWVTLARLYRPFYYNIVDNRFGKRLMRVYIAVAFLGFLLSGFDVTPFPNFPLTADQKGIVRSSRYLDEARKRGPEEFSSKNPTLASRYATQDYLEYFVPLNESRLEDILDYRYPDLQPLTPSTYAFASRSNPDEVPHVRIDSTLAALSSVLRISLNDSLVADVPWRFYEHPEREQPGLLYDIPVYDLPRGEYWLRLERETVRKDSTYWKDVSLMSFMR